MGVAVDGARLETRPAAWSLGIVFGIECLLSPGGAVQVIDGEVHRDAVEPGQERSPELESRQVPIGADERILGDVVRHLVTPRHSHRYRVDPSLVAPDDLGKRVLVAGASPQYELAIGLASALPVLGVGRATQACPPEVNTRVVGNLFPYCKGRAPGKKQTRQTPARRNRSLPGSH